jgi:hypothetical protein
MWSVRKLYLSSVAWLDYFPRNLDKAFSPAGGRYALYPRRMRGILTQNPIASPPDIMGAGYVTDKKTKNSGVMIVAFAAVAAWQIYDMATASEIPSRALVILQYVILAGLLLGLIGALLNFVRSQ